jgi:hypothetical protein
MLKKVRKKTEPNHIFEVFQLDRNYALLDWPNWLQGAWNLKFGDIGHFRYGLDGFELCTRKGYVAIDDGDYVARTGLTTLEPLTQSQLAQDYEEVAEVDLKKHKYMSFHFDESMLPDSGDEVPDTKPIADWVDKMIIEEL